MLPNCVVIGGTRCGTTSLHYYLSLHPEICVSYPKELDFFIRDRNWQRGRGWYEAQFRAQPGVRACVECSPNYSLAPHFAGVPERMHGLLPHARLIYILRDPLARLISHHRQAVDHGAAPLDINTAIQDFGTSRFVLGSLQHFQLSRYLEHYPLSRMLLLTSDDLARRRGPTLRRIFAFLGVDETFEEPRFDRVLNGSDSKRVKNGLGRMLMKLVTIAGHPGRKIPPVIGQPLRRLLLSPFSRPMPPIRLDPGMEQRLLELFREDTARLRQLTGLGLPGWCV